MASPWHRGPWVKVRLPVLERDGWLCQIKGPGCTTIATQVDHIVPPRLDGTGGAWYDPRNLRAACQHCNGSRGGVDARRRARTRYLAKPSRDW
jgi:5-methylcytosine-specific restriction protein A